MKRVLSNVTILEGEELEPVHGYLVIRDGTIQKIAGGSPAKRGTDLKNGFILPPLVNSHTHIADSVAKEIYLGKTQPQVVGPKGEKFRVLSSCQMRELAVAVHKTLNDMLRTGTLAHCDFREGGVKGIEFLRRASRTAVKSIILGRPSEIGELNKVLERSDGIGLPSLKAFDEDELKFMAKRAKLARKLFSIHVAETRVAQESSIREVGKSEVERALELDPSFIVHATHASGSDFEKLRKKSVPVVFCPRANSLLGVGLPPIQLALEKGVRFCFGTDNVAICQPNMFEELSFAWSCLRRVDTSAGSEEARRLLQAATVEPIKIFDLSWAPVKEGGEATFMHLARMNNLADLTDIHAGLVNRARADNIRAIYVRGKII